MVEYTKYGVGLPWSSWAAAGHQPVDVRMRPLVTQPDGFLRVIFSIYRDNQGTWMCQYDN